MTIEAVLERFPDAKKNGTGWKVKCPAHEDQTPSLSVSEGAEGRVLIKCHAGCSTEAICSAAGIRTADLFPAHRNGNPRRIVDTYDYQDANGALAFQVVRFEPKGFSQRRPDPKSPGRYIWDTEGVEKVLFRLPEIKKAGRETIFVCEGEKDVLAMVAHGLVATCNPGGAGKWSDTYTETLRDCDVVIIADKDDAGRKHAQLVATALSGIAKYLRVIELPDINDKSVKDASDFFAAGGDAGQVTWIADAAPEWTPDAAPTQTQPTANDTNERVARIRFYSPSELRAYVPETGVALVGDSHVMRGETFLIGGEPGVGKSLATTSLAVAGATSGSTWFGLPVHRQFRTMIVQTENGKYRLQQEYGLRDCGDLDDWIRVSEPPPFGLTLTHPEFQEDIRAALESFKPDCVILDPWNAAARDDKQRDYSETFDALRKLLPTGSDKPALGIVAHTRKPALNEKRTGGTGLMHILSGSYILTSVPRSIFVMVRGSDDETSDSVIWCNPKNSNGPLAARSAWHRKDGGFVSYRDFDWSEFDKPPDKRVIVRVEHLEEVFQGGKINLELKDAAHALATLTGINENSAYNALASDGKFKDHVTRKGSVLSFNR